jgi:hypothetical protein
MKKDFLLKLNLFTFLCPVGVIKIGETMIQLKYFSHRGADFIAALK